MTAIGKAAVFESHDCRLCKQCRRSLPLTQDAREGRDRPHNSAADWSIGVLFVLSFPPDYIGSHPVAAAFAAARSLDEMHVDMGGELTLPGCVCL